MLARTPLYEDEQNSNWTPEGRTVVLVRAVQDKLVGSGYPSAAESKIKTLVEGLAGAAFQLAYKPSHVADNAFADPKAAFAQIVQGLADAKSDGGGTLKTICATTIGVLQEYYDLFAEDVDRLADSLLCRNELPEIDYQAFRPDADSNARNELEYLNPRSAQPAPALEEKAAFRPLEVSTPGIARHYFVRNAEDVAELPDVSADIPEEHMAEMDSVEPQPFDIWNVFRTPLKIGAVLFAAGLVSGLAFNANRLWMSMQEKAGLLSSVDQSLGVACVVGLGGTAAGLIVARSINRFKKHTAAFAVGAGIVAAGITYGVNAVAAHPEPRPTCERSGYSVFGNCYGKNGLALR